MDDAVCENIGPRQRRLRRNFGVVALAAGIAWVLVTWRLEYPPYTRLAGFVLFQGGFTGIFQARAKTCIRLASRGLRNLDGGPVTIEDAAELDAVRAQASRVVMQSLLAAAIVSAASLLLP